ncbi:MAG: YfhO family protein [Rubrobacter sp.]|nr:YfhO family protein [Rubrobacter sp.]
MTPAAKSLRFRFLPAVKRRADLAAGLALVVLTLIAGWNLVGDGTVVGKDTITQFYPWYSFLGESLRSGNIPAWNPYQFSGAPFAGDPLSGWTYLPAMLLFTLLPLAVAASGYLIFHLLLAGLGTYALARTLRMNLAGAMLAAVAYEYTGYLYTRNLCCFAYVGVSAWLPLAILGAELAIRSTRWLDRGLWWGLSGLALSQILAAWLGQGSYYALLALGGYVAYRTLLFPPENIRGPWGRVSGLFLHGGAVLVFGFGLAAAGILPRLEYNALSNLSDGYAGIGADETVYGGWKLKTWGKLLVPSGIYAGLPTLALALAAPLIARGRHAVPYFFVLSICALTLSGQGVTLLHSTLYHLLPGFEAIHTHGPERLKVILYLGFALLAGATLSSLAERGKSAGALAALPILTSLFLVTRPMSSPPTDGTPDFLDLGIGVPPDTMLALIFVMACVAAYALLPSARPLTAALVVLVLFVELFTAGSSIIEKRATSRGALRTAKVDLAGYYEPTGAAGFLKSKAEGEPIRYFGYGSYIQGEKQSLQYHYSRWFDPSQTAFLASNLATPLGLQSIQGYNAVHIGLYDEFIDEVNGESQNYHDTDVFPKGVDSPLLDLLNVRYIIVPTDPAPDQGVLRGLKDKYPTAYSGDRVDVLENTDALPRAWIVHSARQATPRETLHALSSGAVNPRKTALLERPPPDLARPDDPAKDQASVTTYEANRIRLRARTGSPGLLMLSEVYYPAWKAYVDGEPVPIRRADHLLRSVVIPKGEHTVELRYESWSLRIGMAVSLIFYAGLAGLVAVRLRRWRKNRAGFRYGEGWIS